MNFNLENRDETIIFTILNKSIEGKTAAELKSKIIIVAQPDIKSLILDLTNVELMDSSGLGALLLAHRQHKEHGFPVVLVGVQDFIKSLLKITRIEDIFVYSSSVEEALKLVE